MTTIAFAQQVRAKAFGSDIWLYSCDGEAPRLVRGLVVGLVGVRAVFRGERRHAVPRRLRELGAADRIVNCAPSEWAIDWLRTNYTLGHYANVDTALLVADESQRFAVGDLTAATHVNGFDEALGPRLCSWIEMAQARGLKPCPNFRDWIRSQLE